MWNGYNEGSGSKEKLGYVEEGNVRRLIITAEHQRVRFLTEDVSVESVMAELGITREEATDRLFTKVVRDRWVMPHAYWEHQIKEIPGKRYFSTAACPGRGSCPMCAENDAAKANGINENKLLPYAVRKRFVAPAWSYDLSMVVYVVNNEDFFNDVATYINKHGSAIDFEIWKVGKGLETKYKSAYVGPAELKDASSVSVVAPRDLVLTVDDAELRRRMEGGKSQGRASQPAPQPQPAPQAAPQGEPAPAAADLADPGSFELTFGTHKGMTLKQLFDLGEVEYIQFLANNSAGMVQAKAKGFLDRNR